MAEEKATQEEAFRDSLKDVLIVVKKLAPLCKDLEELAGMIDLALLNDGQLALIINQVGPVQLKR